MEAGASLEEEERNDVECIDGGCELDQMENTSVVSTSGATSLSLTPVESTTVNVFKALKCSELESTISEVSNSSFDKGLRLTLSDDDVLDNENRVYALDSSIYNTRGILFDPGTWPETLNYVKWFYADTWDSLSDKFNQAFGGDSASVDFRWVGMMAEGIKCNGSISVRRVLLSLRSDDPVSVFLSNVSWKCTPSSKHVRRY
uniref:Uncharacterized protein n=1 Tax=Lepeophtheirus salmonis TaxID=72036 RepID=A0A0K2VLK0_LEPSM